MIDLHPDVTQARNQAIADAINAAGAGAELRIYGVAQPAPGADVLESPLATLELAYPVGPSQAGAFEMQSAGYTQAAQEGDATWCRIVDGSGKWVMDLAAGGPGSGAPVELTRVNFYTGAFVDILSATVTG